MDSSAIKEIEQLSNVAHTSLPETDHPAVVIAGSNKVESLEHLQERPYRMRARFVTERISDFTRYVNASREPGTAVFIATDGASATAVIDLGTHEKPDWATHKASLAMKHTPEFEAAKQATMRELTQRRLIDFLEDWRDLVKPYSSVEDDEGENIYTDMTVGQAIAAIRRVDIKKARDETHEHRDMSRQKTAMESVEAASGAGALPGGFRFHCRPFPETIDRELDLRLSLHTSGDSPSFSLRIVGLEQLNVLVAEEVEEKIRHQIGNVEQAVFVGAIETR